MILPAFKWRPIAIPMWCSRKPFSVGFAIRVARGVPAELTAIKTASVIFPVLRTLLVVPVLVDPGGRPRRRVVPVAVDSGMAVGVETVGGAARVRRAPVAREPAA